MFRVSGRSAPAHFAYAGLPQQFTDVRLDDAVPQISIELLATLIEHKSRTALDLELIALKVIGGQ